MIRLEHGISVRRFCELVGLGRASYYRRRRRESGPVPARGRWPTPVLDRIDPFVAEVASSFGLVGYRKVWGRLRLDGEEGISASSVRRSRRRQGLLTATPLSGRTAGARQGTQGCLRHSARAP